VGEAVKEIQQALKIQVDGFFGAKTEEAVKEFQAAQSLDADGIVGPRTRAKLIPTKPEEDKIPSRQPMGSWWLARGAVGESVKEIQRALGVPVDGFFGPRTEQAVKEFQGAHSLDADGVVGPRTRAELARVQTAVPEKKDAQTAPQPPVPESPAMAQLVSMGFPDVNLNAELLKKHNGDVEQVIAVLIGA
jgi:peptidoglycan hydrolase-like protein with peptidoglycan-binding domain